MALFFNLANLEVEAKGSDERFMTLLSNHYYKKLPKSLRLIPKLNLNGNSFILHPDPLFTAPKSFNKAYLIQYIKLAGRRDYTFFKEYAVISLPLSYYPDIDLDNLSTNPLLKITRTEILFKFEEEIRNTNGISIRQYPRQGNQEPS